MNDSQNQLDAHLPRQQTQHSFISSSKPAKHKDSEQTSAVPAYRQNLQKNCLTGSLYLSEVVEQQTHLLVQLLGYSLLLFALLDYIHIVIPPHFTNLLWEFRTIGSLVEHVVIPLMGLVLVFYRRQGYIGKLEKNILGLLSWFSLLIGLIYLLIIPLGIADTWRIYYANKAQINFQVFQQNQNLEQLKIQLNQATTDEQIKKIAVDFNAQTSPPQIKNKQAFKDQLRLEISQAEQNTQMQADSARLDQAQAVIKDSVKWNLGALVSGTLFIVIWRLTYWARVRE